MDPQTLAFGTHEMLIFPESLQLSNVQLFIQKKKGDESVHCNCFLKIPVLVEDVVASWQKQGGEWNELLVNNAGFYALRVIKIEGAGLLVWFVDHINNEPRDQLFFTVISTDKLIEAYKKTSFFC